MVRKALLAFLFSLQVMVLAQEAAPIPRPTPPEEPIAHGILHVQVSKEGQPLPGVWVALQPVTPNGLPNGKPLARRTDAKGETSLPLPQSLRNLRLILLDTTGSFRLQIPLEQALGDWTLGPYRLEVRVALP